MNSIKEYKEFDEFVMFTIVGKEDYFSWLKNLAEIEDMCRENDHRKILIVKKIDGQLTMIDTFRLFKLMSILFLDKKLAIVDSLSNENYILNDFGESVFNSSGVLGKIFATEKEAANWLL